MSNIILKNATAFFLRKMSVLFQSFIFIHGTSSASVYVALRELNLEESWAAGLPVEPLALVLEKVCTPPSSLETPPQAVEVKPS